MSPTSDLLALARALAAKHALDFSFVANAQTYSAAALVCAIVEQESAWDACAIRYEPAFRTRYVAPLRLTPTEEIARSMSWGLMQVMGQVAREHGFAGKFLSALTDPAAGLDIGCAVLASKLAAARATVVIPNPAAPSADGGEGSASPTASLGGRSFSSDITNRAEGVSTLPKAVVEATPEQQTAASQQQSAASPRLGQGIALNENTIARALQLWNGGANPDYAAQVLARLPRYK